MIAHSAIEWFRHFGEFAVSTRKPIFVRWAEEAEAKKVRLWAGRERETPRAEARSDSYAAPPANSRPWALLLRRLRSLLRPTGANCARR